MSAAQPGILTPIPVVGRYLFFSISQPEQVAATLASLAAATDGYQLVVGIGHSLMLSLGKTVEGMKDYPVLAAPGIDLPSTPSALWCWLRGEDRGEVTLRSHALERSLAPAFQRTGAVDAFPLRRGPRPVRLQGRHREPQGRCGARSRAGLRARCGPGWRQFRCCPAVAA